MVFFEAEGQKAKQVTFYDAALIHYQSRLDARGQGREAALVTELHFSAALVEVQGQRVQAYSIIPWTTDAATSFRALTPPTPLLPSLELRAETLARSEVVPVAAADFMRFDKEKKPLAERAQSKKTGYLGSTKLTILQLAALSKTAEGYGTPVRVVKSSEMAIITGNPNARAMFQTKLNAQTNLREATIYLQKGATAYELKHEIMHAKQYSELGFDAYLREQTTLQREEFVYHELMKNKDLLSENEIEHAGDYLHSVKHGAWPKNG